MAANVTAASRPLERPQTGSRRRRPERVTIDFTGPPLRLPGEGDSGEFAFGPDSGAFALEPDAPASDLLDRDLGDAAGHDAWTMDRRRRSTPPPLNLDLPPPVTTPRVPQAARLPGGPPSEPGLADGDGDALDLVDRAPRGSAEHDLAGEMRDRYALGDFTGALRAAQLVLGREPGNEEAERYARSSRERLEHLYASRLGARDQLVFVVVPEAEVRWLGLDHRAGFMLSRIDGAHTVDELVDVSGMDHLEALKTLAELFDIGAIRIGGRDPNA